MSRRIAAQARSLASVRTAVSAPIRTGPDVHAVGIGKEADRPLRFYEAGNAHVSGPSPLRR